MMRLFLIYCGLVFLVGVAIIWGYWLALQEGGPLAPRRPPPQPPAQEQSRIEPKPAPTSAPAETPAPQTTDDLSQPAPTQPATDRSAAPEPEMPAITELAGPTLPIPASAPPSPFPLALPVDCRLGEDCWIIKYVDIDPTKERSDFACGAMTVDGHKGTDIALRDLKRMNERVDVLAAAPGRVVGTRDSMRDVDVRKIGRESLKGRDCGNGVRVDHGNGWVTQYCHLLRGSIRVRQGDAVTAGQPLGNVGLSGATEFPHLHITVEKDGKPVDPFVGIDGGESCTIGRVPLWNAEVRRSIGYTSPVLYNLGFTGRVPEKGKDEVRFGAVRDHPLSPESPVLLFFMQMSGIVKGDEIEAIIADQDGAILVEHTETAERTRLLRTLYIGKKLKSARWPAGRYTGTLTVTRPSTGVRRSETTLVTVN